MTDVSAKRLYYPALDGLRGVAILLVVLLHNFGFMNYFFFGWLGVDLFFVLSGFLITEILLNNLDTPHSLRNFYIRRVLRIFPVFYLLLIVCLWVLPHIDLLNLNLAYYTSNQHWFWVYLQNWLFIFKEPYGNKLLIHTWSLAVEEQFYLLWPAAVVLIKKPKRLLALAAFVLFAVSLTRFLLWINKIDDLAYASLYTFTRIDGICVGCIIALLMKINPDWLKRNTAIIVFSFALLNFSFYFISTRYSFTLPFLAFAGYTTFAMLFGLLVYDAALGHTKLIQFLFNNRFLKFFGKISYGLYMYHWPIYMLCFGSCLKLLETKLFLPHQYALLSSSVLVTILSIIVSVISLHYFENIFTRLKSRF